MEHSLYTKPENQSGKSRQFHELEILLLGSYTDYLHRFLPSALGNQCTFSHFIIFKFHLNIM
jgi:hypothetical protein